VDLEQMKQKYASVLTVIQEQRVQLSHLHIQDGKFFMQGVAPSDQAKNQVWDQIKVVNPNWAQELIADISVDSTAQSGAASSADGARKYTVQAGDSLSKISKTYYGDANQYMKIFEANQDVVTDPNKIFPGQTLKIPQ
jgi:nucleoid-associated protein YgaU